MLNKFRLLRNEYVLRFINSTKYSYSAYRDFLMSLERLSVRPIDKYINEIAASVENQLEYLHVSLENLLIEILLANKVDSTVGKYCATLYREFADAYGEIEDVNAAGQFCTRTNKDPRLPTEAEVSLMELISYFKDPEGQLDALEDYDLGGDYKLCVEPEDANKSSFFKKADKMMCGEIPKASPSIAGTDLKGADVKSSADNTNSNPSNSSAHNWSESPAKDWWGSGSPIKNK